MSCLECLFTWPNEQLQLTEELLLNNIECLHPKKKGKNINNFCLKVLWRSDKMNLALFNTEESSAYEKYFR